MRRRRRWSASDRESAQRDLYRKHRARRLPALEDLRAGDDRRAGRDLPINPFDLTKVWPHARLPADRSGRAGAQPQSGELLRRGGAGGVLAGEHGARASASRPTRCCRRGCSRYGDAQRYRLGVNFTPDSGECAAVPGPQLPPRRAMRVDGNHGGATSPTCPTASGEWAEQPELPSRRCRRRAAQTTGTTASTRTTTRSRARCSG